MNRWTWAGVAASLLIVGAWLAAWLPAEEPPEQLAPDRPPTAEIRPARTSRAETPGEVQQWLRQMSPMQKRAILRALLVALREDLVEGYRRAAEEQFRRADANDDGMLTFDEAWHGGIFRAGHAGVEERGARGGGRGLRERLRERSQARADLREADARPEPGLRSLASQFPVSEIEEELLESWEVLQELNVLSQDAGE